MASQRHVNVGGVQVGGGAPVVVQTMTKTETANLTATMDQIRRVADAGADLVRVAVPRDKDVEALKTIVRDSPIPIIADIHFNHTLALKAIDAGAHCVRLNPGNIGGPDKVAEVAQRATAAGVPMRIGVNSGSLPKHLHELERENSVEALVTAGVEFVELMERLDFTDFKVSIKSTNVPNTIAANRLLSERIPYPLHLGITEAGTKWSGSLKSAVGLGTLLADGIGDTIRISLSTFHAEEEVKVAWEILKALKLRERGPVLIACPTCGRLQFDMDTVVADIEKRLEAYADPVEVAVLGCAVNGTVAGRIVAWSIKLSRPSDKQLEFFEEFFGGEPTARLSILKPIKKSPKRRQATGEIAPTMYKLKSQGPVEQLTPFLGTTTTFALQQPLKVAAGQVVALTVPTYAPAFAVSQGDKTAWRASRKNGKCTNAEDIKAGTAHEVAGQTRAYGCSYKTARLLYSATLVADPGAAKKKKPVAEEPVKKPAQ